MIIIIGLQMGCQRGNSGNTIRHNKQHIQTNTHNNNDKWHISHETTQLLGQFTETEHKTAHTTNWSTTQNEYNHNCINKRISVAILWGVPVTRYVMREILPSFNPNLLPNTSPHFTSLHAVDLGSRHSSAVTKSCNIIKVELKLMACQWYVTVQR
jgi:hypothetical protein